MATNGAVPQGASFADEPVAHCVRDAHARDRCDLTARVREVAHAPDRPVDLDVVVDDGTGTMLCCFSGRTAIPGVEVGRWLWVAGRVVTYRARRCLLNPAYGFVDAPEITSDESS